MKKENVGIKEEANNKFNALTRDVGLLLGYWIIFLAAPLIAINNFVNSIAYKHHPSSTIEYIFIIFAATVLFVLPYKLARLENKRQKLIFFTLGLVAPYLIVYTFSGSALDVLMAPTLLLVIGLFLFSGYNFFQEKNRAKTIEKIDSIVGNVGIDGRDNRKNMRLLFKYWFLLVAIPVGLLQVCINNYTSGEFNNLGEFTIFYLIFLAPLLFIIPFRSAKFSDGWPESVLYVIFGLILPYIGVYIYVFHIAKIYYSNMNIIM
jgi:hypothetical protein